MDDGWLGPDGRSYWGSGGAGICASREKTRVRVREEKERSGSRSMHTASRHDALFSLAGCNASRTLIRRRTSLFLVHASQDIC